MVYRRLGEALISCEQAHVEQLAETLPELYRQIGPADAWTSRARTCPRSSAEFIDLRGSFATDDSREDDHEECLVYVNHAKAWRPRISVLGSHACRICGSRGDAWDKLTSAQEREVAPDRSGAHRREAANLREARKSATGSAVFVIAIRAAAFEQRSSSAEARQTTASTMAEPPHDQRRRCRKGPMRRACRATPSTNFAEGKSRSPEGRRNIGCAQSRENTSGP